MYERTVHSFLDNGCLLDQLKSYLAFVEQAVELSGRLQCETGNGVSWNTELQFCQIFAKFKSILTSEVKDPEMDLALPQFWGQTIDLW